MNSTPKHKRKWTIAAAIIIGLLLLLPAVIGHLVRSQTDAQLALQQHTAQWQRGWWSSRLAGIESAAMALEVDIHHGPVWLNPFGTGIARLNGWLQPPGAARLPLTGEVTLSGDYRVKQIIPVSYYQQTGGWSVSQVNSNAYVQLQGELGGQSGQVNLKYPQGMLHSAGWQLSWQDVLSQLDVTNTIEPLVDGGWNAQARTLRWRPQAQQSAQHILHSLELTLDWPQDEDIRLRLHAPRIQLIGQTQDAEDFSVALDAVSIDRAALSQWLQTLSQAGAGPAGDASRLLALAGVLAAHPQLRIEQLQLDTPAGLIELQGHLAFRPGQREARLHGGMPAATADWLARALMVDPQAAADQVQSMIQNGLLQRDGDRLLVDLVVNL